MYDRYYNSTRHNRKRKALNEICIFENSSISKTVEFDENLAASMKAWLRYNDSPLEEVNEKWNKTFDCRKYELNISAEKNEVITKFLNDWPLYKNSNLGPSLV